MRGADPDGASAARGAAGRAGRRHGGVHAEGRPAGAARRGGPDGRGAGGTAIAPELAARALTAPAGPRTEREAQALVLAADGCEPREIAERLHLRAGTVRNYLAAAQVRLDARTRLDAVRIAREAGRLPTSVSTSAR